MAPTAKERCKLCRRSSKPETAHCTTTSRTVLSRSRNQALSSAQSICLSRASSTTRLQRPLRSASAVVEKSIEDAQLNLSSIDRESEGLTRQEHDPVVNLNEGIRFLQKNLKALEGKYKDLAKFYGGNERTTTTSQQQKETDLLPHSATFSPGSHHKRQQILTDLTELDSAIQQAKRASEQALQDMSQAMNQVSVLVLGADHTLFTSLTQAKESLSGQLNQLDKIASVNQNLSGRVLEETSQEIDVIFKQEQQDMKAVLKQLEDQKQSSQRQLQQMEKTMTELRMQNADLRSKLDSSAKDIKLKQNSNLQANQKISELQSLIQSKDQDLISLADQTKTFLTNLRLVQKSVQRGGSDTLKQQRSQFDQSKELLERLLSKVNGPAEQISFDLEVESSGDSLHRLKRELAEIQGQHTKAVGQHCVVLKNVKQELMKVDSFNQRKGELLTHRIEQMSARILEATLKQRQLKAVVQTLKQQWHLSTKVIGQKEKEIRQLSSRLAYAQAQSKQLEEARSDLAKLRADYEQVLSSQKQTSQSADSREQQFERRLGEIQALSAIKINELSTQLDQSKTLIAEKQSEYELLQIELNKQLAHQVKLNAELQQKQEEVIASIVKSHSAKSDDLARKLAEVTQAKQQSEAQLQQDHSKATNELHQSHERVIADLKAAHKRATDDLCLKHTLNLDDLRQKHSSQLDSLAAQAEQNHTQGQAEMQLLQVQNQLEKVSQDFADQQIKLANLQERHASEIQKLHHQLKENQTTASKQQAQLEDYEHCVKTLKKSNEEALERLQHSHRLDLVQAQTKLAQSEDSTTAQIAALQNQIFSASTQQRNLSQQLDQARQTASELQQTVTDLQQQVDSTASQLQEEQLRTSEMEQTLESNLYLTQQLKESLQKALEKSKNYKRELVDQKIGKAELERQLGTLKLSRKQDQHQLQTVLAAVKELKSGLAEIASRVRSQHSLENGAYHEYIDFVTLQVKRLTRNASQSDQMQNYMESMTAHFQEQEAQFERLKQTHLQQKQTLEKQLADMMVERQVAQVDLQQLREELREQAEELMAKNELIEEANNFIVEYTEEKHELKAKFKVLVGGLLCDQTVSSYKSTDQVDIDKCFELIEQTLLDRSTQQQPLQSRLLNELQQVMPSKEVQQTRQVAADFCTDVATICEVLLRAKASSNECQVKVRTKLEQAQRMIGNLRGQLQGANQQLSQMRIQKASLEDKLTIEQTNAAKESEDLVMRLAQAEVECEQLQQQLAVAQRERQSQVELVRRAAELETEVQKLRRDKLDLQAELEQVNANESLHASDQGNKSLIAENAQLLQRLMKCQAQLAQQTPQVAGVDPSQFEAKLDALRKDFTTIFAQLQLKAQEQLTEAIAATKQAYVEERILLHNCLSQTDSWNGRVELCCQLEIQQRVYWLAMVSDQQQQFYLFAQDELTEAQLLYLRSFSDTRDIFVLEDCQEATALVKELRQDLLELRHEYRDYCCRVTGECSERTETGLRDEVEYLVGENKDLQIKLKQLCLANASLKNQVSSHLMQDVTGHDLREVLQKDEPNSFMSDHDSFIVEALNSDSKQASRPLDLSQVSEGTTMEHVKATLVMFLQKVPTTDAKNEELLKIVFSMLSFTRQEQDELTKTRQLLRPPAKVGSTSAQVSAGHTSQEEQSVKSDTVKKGIMGFFKSNSSASKIHAPSPTKK